MTTTRRVLPIRITHTQIFEMLDAHVQTETFSSSLLTAKQHAEAHYWQASGLCMQMAEVEQQWSHLTTAPEPVQTDVRVACVELQRTLESNRYPRTRTCKTMWWCSAKR